MGLRFRRQIGPKGLKLNIGKKGFNSTSFKIAKGITYNTKRGLTLGLPGTGISYNFGKKKPATRTRAAAKTTNSLTTAERKEMYQQRIANMKASSEIRRENSIKLRADMKVKTEIREERSRKFKEFTGGYNKKAIIAIIISFVLCVTPLWPIGILASIPSLIWFIIDTIVKTVKFNKHLKETPENI